MPSAQQTKLILHLSDLRVRENTRIEERVEAIIRALKARSEPRDLFDFIVVTGDIKDRDADAATAYETAHSFLDLLGKSLLRKIDAARVLVVPGDHDWCQGSVFLHYNRFVQEWYGQSPIARCLKSADSDEAPVAYLVDHRDDDVVFLLMNSYWKNTQTEANDRLLTGEVCESQRQSFDMELELVFKKSSERPPMLALMHQHLIPTHDYPPDERNLIFSQDCPATIEWLSKHQTVIAFHGPPPGYALLRTDEILTPQAERRKGTELIVLGSGACGGERISGEEKQFQEITVNLKPRRFLESTIERTEYRWEGATWIRSPEPFTSHETFSAFSKSLVDAEQFTCDQLHHDMWHPLRSEPAKDWFWKHYDPLWNERYPNKPRDGQTLLQRKEEFLEDLVVKLKDHNSGNWVFELLPFQLDAIYTYVALFFSNKNIEEAAIREFKSRPWQSWLKFNDIADYALWNHLDWANWIIADQLRAWTVKTKPERVGIVDLGFGRLRTIDAIGRNIPDVPLGYRYLGIDVSDDQRQLATEMIAQGKTAGSFFVNPRTEPFNGIGVFFVTEAGRKFWRPGYEYLEPLSDNGFNVFVCAYAMHHSSNSFRVRKSLMDGSFFRFIAHSPESGTDHLVEHLGSEIIDRADVNMRAELIKNLVLLSHEVKYNNPQAEGHRPLIQKAIERVLELAFPNSQSDVYKMVFDTMQDGGLLCVADPNGMSKTFNRQQILRNPAIAIAHFSDWTDAVLMIHEAGFREIRGFRQIRLNNLQVRRVAIPQESIEAIVSKDRELTRKPFDEPILPEGFEQFKSVFQMRGEKLDTLEILDQHMGYILIAEKPKAV